MSRTYQRDSHGRFAGGGGGGGGNKGGGKKGGGKPKAAAKPKAPAKPKAAPKSKAGQTKAANNARTKELRQMGLTGTGNRMNKAVAAKYSGSAATKAGRAKLWSNVADMKKNAATGQSAYPSKSPNRKGTIRKRGK